MTVSLLTLELDEHRIGRRRKHLARGRARGVDGIATMDRFTTIRRQTCPDRAALVGDHCAIANDRLCTTPLLGCGTAQYANPSRWSKIAGVVRHLGVSQDHPIVDDV